MKRITAILAPLALATSLLVGPWAAARLPFDEVSVLLVTGEMARIPETDIRVSYNGGYGLCSGRGCIPSEQYAIVRGQSGRSTTNLVGQQLGPWTVADVRVYHEKAGLLARWLGGTLGLEVAGGPIKVAKLVRR